MREFVQQHRAEAHGVAVAGDQQPAVQAHDRTPGAAEHHRAGRPGGRVDDHPWHRRQPRRGGEFREQGAQFAVRVRRFQRDDPAAPGLPQRQQPEQQRGRDGQKGRQAAICHHDGAGAQSDSQYWKAWIWPVVLTAGPQKPESSGPLRRPVRSRPGRRRTAR
nr:hypothetical protein [Streptomyces sp. SJL17-1]